ncbi:hypothetical protein HEQ62_10725 [Haematospirillum jordaniae]|nr:hypothetical protein [Haematospirillum jordaniae]NKD74895.1 hypothetical protein [Haematospirillum sp. H4485]NKD46225.1 hypothetical protein [Haematospirillum jordaniae]NKD58132.1 hypothetical protein [Haematospirillum jordaniae]NKD60241.1 hypothetical protein [Haematospirillum jordaniae]NKD68179.1 hypothetical protein [Haematospirillum jordaniae]
MLFGVPDDEGLSCGIDDIFSDHGEFIDAAGEAQTGALPGCAVLQRSL